MCSWLGSLWGLANTLLGLFISIRRLHDIGRSGWWWLMLNLGFLVLGMWLVASLFLVPALLLVFVPLFLAIALVELKWACSSSEPRVNRYGAVPNVR